MRLQDLVINLISCIHKNTVMENMKMINFLNKEILDIISNVTLLHPVYLLGPWHSIYINVDSLLHSICVFHFL